MENSLCQLNCEKIDIDKGEDEEEEIGIVVEE
jgi:hypothetical protein